MSVEVTGRFVSMAVQAQILSFYRSLSAFLSVGVWKVWIEIMRKYILVKQYCLSVLCVYDYMYSNFYVCVLSVGVPDNTYISNKTVLSFRLVCYHLMFGRYIVCRTDP